MKIGVCTRISLMRDIANTAAKRISTDQNIVGVILYGSVARGNATPSSDIDIMAFIAKGDTHFEDFKVEDYLVAIQYHPVELYEKLVFDVSDPSWDAYVEMFSSCRILYDPNNILKTWIDRLQSGMEEMREERLVYMLQRMEGLVRKAEVSLDRGDYKEAIHLSRRAFPYLYSYLFSLNMVIPHYKEDKYLRELFELQRAPQDLRVNLQTIFNVKKDKEKAISVINKYSELINQKVRIFSEKPWDISWKGASKLVEQGEYDLAVISLREGIFHLYEELLGYAGKEKVDEEHTLSEVEIFLHEKSPSLLEELLAVEEFQDNQIYTIHTLRNLVEACSACLPSKNRVNIGT